jgi:hypothetical protein
MFIYPNTYSVAILRSHRASKQTARDLPTVGEDRHSLVPGHLGCWGLRSDIPRSNLQSLAGVIVRQSGEVPPQLWEAAIETAPLNRGPQFLDAFTVPLNNYYKVSWQLGQGPIDPVTD